MTITLAAFIMSLAAAIEPAAAAGGPAAACHAQIDARCAALRGEEALRCRNEADAQCDIREAEHFIGEGEVVNAESRVNLACEKYERQIAMLDRSETELLVAAMIDYAAVSESIFALLAREGAADDLRRAVTRLRASRRFLRESLARSPGLAEHPELAPALVVLTRRLADALDKLGRRVTSDAAESAISDRGTGGGEFGRALEDYADAAECFEEAYALEPETFVHRLDAFKARLALADLQAEIGRREHAKAALACKGYAALRADVADVRRTSATIWSETPELREVHARADRGARSCSARPRVIAGAAMLGTGAAGLAVALGLYAQYSGACDFGPGDDGKNYCAGFMDGTPEDDRYTRQVHASIGLAAVGGALVGVGTAVMVQGIVQRRRARPRRVQITPSLGPRAGAIAVTWAF